MPDAATNLESATRVTGADGDYRGRVDRRWFIWGPNGGYLSAFVLRAAARESGFGRLASYSCQFLGVAKEGEVRIRVVPLKRTRRADAFRVEMFQDERPVLFAILRLVADGLEGLTHRHRPMPDVPAPAALESFVPEQSSEFFRRLERKPVPSPHGMPRSPRSRTWMRFRGAARFDDALVDSLRPLIVSDTLYWPAALMLHGPAAGAYTAPGLHLHLRFHHFGPASEWLFCEAHSFFAEDGLLAADSAVWTEDGVLLVTSSTQALMTPRRAD